MRERLNRGTFTLIAWAILLCLVLTPVPIVAEEEPEEDGLPWRFNMNAMNTGRGPRSARLEININRWTTDDERAALLEVLRQGNSSSLARAVQREESVGRVRPVQGLGEELRYARRTVHEDGSQQILLATDRPIAFIESWRGSRTRDYNITIFILDLDATGRGDGILMVGAEASFNADIDQITVEHMTTQPVRLTQVRRR